MSSQRSVTPPGVIDVEAEAAAAAAAQKELDDNGIVEVAPPKHPILAEDVTLDNYDPATQIFTVGDIGYTMVKDKKSDKVKMVTVQIVRQFCTRFIQIRDRQ